MRPKRSERFAIRFSPTERRVLEKIALQEDVTITHLVRQGIKQVLLSKGEAQR